jgi:hypothetical protein
MSGFGRKSVGFDVGFLKAPDMEWPNRINNLGHKRRVCRDF